MGPGLALKACFQGGFSLMIFGWSQILMDLQPLFAVMTGIGELHGISHTYVGASVIAVIAVYTGKPISEYIFRRLRSELSEFSIRFIAIPTTISFKIAFVSALIGVYSHVALDSLLYYDIKPLFPFSDANGLLNLLRGETVYWVCIVLGVVGVFVYLVVRRRIMRRIPDARERDN